MVNPVTKIRIAPDTNHCFADAVSMLYLYTLQTMLFAATVVQGDALGQPFGSFKPTWPLALSPMPSIFVDADGRSWRLSPQAFVSECATGRMPTEVVFEEVDATEVLLEVPIEEMESAGPTPALSFALNSVVSSSFVHYYASIEHQIKLRFKDDSQQWPAAADFARAVRNGFAHGNCWSFENTKRTVTWRGWTKGVKDNGSPILYGADRFGFFDIIQLMLEVDGQLRS